MRPWRITNTRRGLPVSRVPDLAPRIRNAALLEGDFVLSSGERSSFYVDKYLFSTEPDLLRDVADALAAEIPGGVERLAGVELGAVPLVVATALATGLPYVIVRKSCQRAWQLRRTQYRRQPLPGREGSPPRGRRHHGYAGRAGRQDPRRDGSRGRDDSSSTRPQGGEQGEARGISFPVFA